MDNRDINPFGLNVDVIACGFGEAAADVRGRDLLAAAYSDCSIVTMDAGASFGRGSRVHGINRQQPSRTS